MLPRNTIGVYLIRNTVTGAVYVGSSRKSIYERWLRHIKALRENRHDNQRLQRAWNKYSESAFELVMHEVVDDVEQVRPREQFWIEHYRAQNSDYCYNLSRLATGGGPIEWTPEMRARLSKSRMGHVVSTETREKLRQKFIGRPLSAEHRKKLSESHKSYKPSRETIEKRAAANRGKSRARIVYEGFVAPDEQVYCNIPNLKRFAVEHGLDYNNMRRVANGQQFAYRGWRRIGTEPKPTYSFLGPGGLLYKNIISLEAFCREHGLTHDCMRLVHIGKQPQHRGWRKA